MPTYKCDKGQDRPHRLAKESFTHQAEILLAPFRGLIILTIRRRASVSRSFTVFVLGRVLVELVVAAAGGGLEPGVLAALEIGVLTALALEDGLGGATEVESWITFGTGRPDGTTLVFNERKCARRVCDLGRRGD
jgi:hypothetical protein